MKKEEILEGQKKYLWPNHILYYTEPMPLDRGDGMYVWDVEDKKYLDFFGGILTTSVGHNNPKVNERATEQMGKLIHSSTLYPNENHVQLAKKIAEITPGDLQASYFGCSGTEADEAAVMLAKSYTGEQTRHRGLLIGKGGLYGNVLRMASPLVATKEHVDEALEILDHAFAQTQEMSW